MPRSKTKINKKNNLPTKNKNNQPQQSSPTSTVAGNVVNGMSFGAGAAIGSTMINGAMDLFRPIPTESNKNNNYCDDLIEQFKQCSLNNSEINNCKPYLELYNQCINK